MKKRMKHASKAYMAWYLAITQGSTPAKEVYVTSANAPEGPDGEDWQLITIIAQEGYEVSYVVPATKVFWDTAETP